LIKHDRQNDHDENHQRYRANKSPARPAIQ
jgi:hypothetical protein